MPIDCNIDCKTFHRASRRQPWSMHCHTSGLADNNMVKLYFDDINLNSNCKRISSGQSSNSVSLNVNGSDVVVAIDNPQPQHFISYTLQASCGDNTKTTSSFTLLETVHGGHSFSSLDYVLFGLFLATSLVIGVALAMWAFYKQRNAHKDATTKDFLLANRSMHTIPLTLSLLCSFLSGVTLIGTPADVYTFGTQYLAMSVGFLLFIPFAANVTMPFFYKLGITSVYEYLEQRFSIHLRRIAAFVYLVHMCLYLAIVVYTPAIAMKAVTGLNMWISAGLSAGICIIYTSLGGLRAAVWTDVFQVTLMASGLLALIIQSSIREGGLFDRAWTMAERGGRIEFFNMDPNPLLRHTFWTVSIGGAFTWGFSYCINQAQIQRAISAKTLREAKLAYWLNLPGLIIFVTMSGLLGITLYSRYAFCDPLLAGSIEKRDQVLPFYVMEVLSEDLPGFPGLFLAMLFSGSLSTISSGLNGLGAVFVSDFAQDYLFDRFNWPEKRRARMTRLFTFGFGVIVLLLVLVVKQVPGLLDATLGILAALSGPIFGIFLVGIFLPFVKWQPVFIGLIPSLAMNIWLILGSQSTQPQNTKILVSTTVGCTNPRAVNQTQLEIPVDFDSMTEWEKFYSVSYMYYSVLGILGVIAVSLLLTPIFGCENPKRFRNGMCNQTTAKWTIAVRRRFGYEFQQVDTGEEKDFKNVE